jgi:hypothetical protein
VQEFHERFAILHQIGDVLVCARQGKFRQLLDARRLGPESGENLAGTIEFVL